MKLVLTLAAAPNVLVMAGSLRAAEYVELPFTYRTSARSADAQTKVGSLSEKARGTAIPIWTLSSTVVT
jgi:hypothetical protein